MRQTYDSRATTSQNRRVATGTALPMMSTLPKARGGLRSGFMKGGAKHIRIHSPGVKRATGARTCQPDLGRTEEHRVYLVEVAVVPLEDLVERSPVVRWGRGRQAVGPLQKLLVAG